MRRNDKIRKVIIWRVLSTILGWGITYMYIGELFKSLELTVVIGSAMTIIHYYYEGWWDND